MTPRHIKPSDVATALKRWRVNHILESEWNSPRIDPYREKFRPVGVMLHHTAGINSRAYIKRGSYPPVRNSQFLIGRDGMVYVMAGAGCYHAGRGGPLTVDGFKIPLDAGNRFLYGIEIESLGTSRKVTDGPNDKKGMTPAQVEAASRLTKALLDLMGRDEQAVIRHRDWAPKRKIDVLQSLRFWRRRIKSQGNSTWDRVIPSGLEPRKNTENNARLQARLYDLGFRAKPASSPDRAKYPRTAIQKAQTAWGLNPSGRLDPKTFRLMFGGVAGR